MYGAVMQWGKACIHMNVHFFVDMILSCLDENDVSFDEHDVQVYMLCRGYDICLFDCCHVYVLALDMI